MVTTTPTTKGHTVTYADDVEQQLPETVTYDQVLQALAVVAPDLEPRYVREITITPELMDLATWHPEPPHERVRRYRIDHVQGAATEGSGR